MIDRTRVWLMISVIISIGISDPTEVFSQNAETLSLGLQTSSTLGTSSLRSIAASPNNPIFLIDQPSEAVRQSVPIPEAVPEPTFFYANPGPWGKLKCFYIYLEPTRSIVDRMRIPSKEIRWTFKRSDEADLGNLFLQAGLPARMRDSLLEPKNQLKTEDEISLFPTKADVEAMTPSMRQAIYPFLASSASGEFYSHPVLIATKTVEEWFRHSNLRPELIAKINQMSYRRGEFIAFSDFSVLMNEAQSDDEARVIYKSLARTRSLMVQLELSDINDLNSIVEYWGAGTVQHRKDIEPILRSVYDTQGMEVLGLVHLLPPLPRKFLYTYPGSDYVDKFSIPDCHWTSANFFNPKSHDYLFDSKRITKFIDENFVDVKDSVRFGDVVFLVERQSGEYLHSCVYLADDLVFTKNGRNSASPWCIMKLANVVAIYSCYAKQADISVHPLRFKNIERR